MPVETLCAEPFSDAVVICDPAGRITHWAGGAERLFGRTEAAARGQSFAALLGAEVPAVAATPCVIRRPDGTVAHGCVRKTALGLCGLENCAWLHLVSETRAPTPAKEHPLQRDNERMTVALRAASVGVWDFDVQTGAQTWDDTMFTLYGCRRGDDPPGCNLWQRGIHAEDYPRVEAEIREALREGGRPFETEFRIVRRTDGELRHVRGIASVVRGQGGEPLRMIGINWDVSSQRRGELERRAIEQQLSQLQKLETLGFLAGGVAHDLNNILSPILGWTEVIATHDLADNEAAQTRLAVIRKATQRAQEIVRRILTFSRATSEREWPAVALNEVVEDTLPLIRAGLPPNMRLRVALAEGLAAVQADPVQLQQVLLNFASNALHAMQARSGGELRLTTRRVTLTAPRETLTGVLGPGEFVALVVGDTGCGIPAEAMKKIFEPFFTTKPREEGLGLGLSVVRRIVENHGGGIAVESEVGRGTAFTLYLPAMAPPSGE